MSAAKKSVRFISLITASLSAVILCALVIGCGSPMGGAGFNLPQNQNANAPEGMAFVSLSISLPAPARSILPTDVSFEQYEIEFVPSSYPSNPIITEHMLFYENGTAKFALATGETYIARVKALKEEGFSDYDIAYGESAPVTIRTDSPNIFSVKLELYDLERFDGIYDGKGIFEYECNVNIFNNGLPDEAVMTITARHGVKDKDPDNHVAEVDLRNGKYYGIISLDSGYYNVLVRIRKGTCTVYYYEVLHIYKNLVSYFNLSTLSREYFSSAAYSGMEVVIAYPSLPDQLEFSFYFPPGTEYNYDAGCLTVEQGTKMIVTVRHPNGNYELMGHISWYIDNYFSDNDPIQYEIATETHDVYNDIEWYNSNNELWGTEIYLETANTDTFLGHSESYTELYRFYVEVESFLMYGETVPKPANTGNEFYIFIERP